MMIEDVIAAKEGDQRAFSRLVRRASPMVLGYAKSYLRDDAMAEDAAQDAFSDAFFRLHQLRDPAAFLGWMRRITHKHCDRRKRRRPLKIDSAEPSPLMGRSAVDGPGRRPPPEPTEATEQTAPEPAPAGWVDLVDRLPAHERIVFALHYLGDEPQKDVAQFLELPLSTVKKRLHSARARLRKWRPAMKSNERNERLEDRMQLFVAIRSGDTDAARVVLERRPELLDAPEQWTTAEALAGGLPIAHRLTPLILAAGRGDREMVRMLLSLGANPNGACGCDANESALFAAALSKREEVVQMLLDAGADPKHENAAGFTAADVARMRKPSSFAGFEKDGRRLVTQIKAIDLFTPLEEGMLVRVHGAAETGLTVLLAELVARMGAAGWRSVWTAGSSGRWQGAELAQAAAELGVAEHVTVARTGAVDDVRTSDEPCALFVFLGDAPESEVEASLPAFRRTAAITFVVEPWADVTAGERPAQKLQPPWDAQICTSIELANEGIYPAIDPASSGSTAEVDERHATIRDAVKAQFGEEEVRRYLFQPFGTAEHLTGMPGESVPVDTMLDGFAARAMLGSLDE